MRKNIDGEGLLWKIAEVVILTVNAIFVGMVVGLFIKGRQDLVLPLAMLMLAGGTVMKIITFKERREAKRRRGETIEEGFHLPPPQESKREW